MARVQALDASAGEATNTDRFAKLGECWGNPEIGELCTTACERGLLRLQRVPSMPQECAP